MKKIVSFLSLAIVAIASTACASGVSDWRGEVQDHESKQVYVEKGKHYLFVTADKPILCRLFRNGEPVEGHSENNACEAKFESKESETLTFFIVYDIKRNAPSSTMPFKYHASLL